MDNEKLEEFAVTAYAALMVLKQINDDKTNEVVDTILAMAPVDVAMQGFIEAVSTMGQ